MTDPYLLVADEPTGDLDREERRRDPRTCCRQLNREFQKTIVMVTHDPLAAERAHIERHLEKGVLAKTIRQHEVAAAPVTA